MSAHSSTLNPRITWSDKPMPSKKTDTAWTTGPGTGVGAGVLVGSASSNCSSFGCIAPKVPWVPDIAGCDTGMGKHAAAKTARPIIMMIVFMDFCFISILVVLRQERIHAILDRDVEILATDHVDDIGAFHDLHHVRSDPGMPEPNAILL